MLSMEEICEEIKCLEDSKHTTWDICKKLAILYIVKDHYKEKEVGEEYVEPVKSMAAPSIMSHTSVPAMSTPTIGEK